MAELRLQHVLESKFVKREQFAHFHLFLTIICVLLCHFVREPEKEDGPDFVPLFEAEVDAVAKWVFPVLVDVVFPVPVIEVFGIDGHSTTAVLFLLEVYLFLALLQKQLSDNSHVFRGSQNLVHRKGDDLVSRHAEHMSFHSETGHHSGLHLLRALPIHHA